MFGELPIEELSTDLPVASLLPHALNPAAEVGGQRVEIQLQALTGKYGQAVRCQDFDQGMYDGMSHRLRARSNFQHSNDFGASIDGEPNPQRVSLLTGLGTELIQLDMQELQVVE